MANAAEIDLAQVLQIMGFEVQPTDFHNLITDETLKRKLQAEFKDTDIGRILRFFPDYFVVHKTVAPNSGTFFAVILVDKQDISNDAASVYRTYFPERTVLLHINSSKREIKAKWIGDSKAPLVFSQFLTNEIGLLLPAQIKQAISSKGWVT
jgi:hypothetical protein